MKFDFVVLGATGMQGKIVARDLLESGYSVLLCGRDKKRVDKILKNYEKSDFRYLDIRDKKNAATILKNSGADTVINCMEETWDLDALNLCIKENAHCLDLGSQIPMTKQQFALGKTLKKKNLTHITGCGSVPGVGSIMLRYVNDSFDKIETIEAGYSWNSNMEKFVVPFSIQSIINEFTAPAPIIEKNKLIYKMPMDSIKEKYHRGIGKQKEFFVVHPEICTFYRSFKDRGVKNVRFYASFPDHSFERIKDMIELGPGSTEEIKFNGTKIKPVEFLTEVLKQIQIPEGYTEKENLWVFVNGRKNGKKKEILMECIVPTLKGWEDAGCNIDTGMPASIMAQMVKKGIIKERGAFAPEEIVPPEPFFKELRKRKMVVMENGKIIN
jgi:saccharopine dehydrogenase (NAD+, L-lysine-forming)